MRWSLARARGLVSFVASCALGSAIVLSSACAPAPRGWNLQALEEAHPAVGQVADHQLEHALPYFALGEEGLALFLCHWSTEAPIPVWLPPRATPEEKLLLERALAAWEGSGLGIRFQSRSWEKAPPPAGIVFEFVEPGAAGHADTASTIADCGIPQEVPAPTEDSLGAAVDAELQYASIHLTRMRRDVLGRKVPLTPSELLGAAVHELGHALGFAGHIAEGRSVMVRRRQVEKTRRWAEQLEAGEPLEAPTLVALYQAPSGARVGWLALERAQLDPLHDLAAAASRVGLRGPWVRVGDQSARILWRDDSARSVAAVALEWPRAVLDSSRFEPRLNRAARMLLETAPR